ncbi:MAG: 4Fe-4S binding protein [Lysobacterales bacterium]|jgi:Fe-S-cluster-containing dehydrogenase component
MDRRDFLKTTLVAGAATLGGNEARALELKRPEEFVGVLVDTTRCIGCRSCEIACGETHDMLVPDVIHDGALASPREIFVKRQCMHCHQAACATACPTEAMHKTLKGPVIWDGDKCIGCRFCMVSCPFDIPKFEYGEWNPRLIKCTMCFERQQEGKKPACVEACPVDALQFGLQIENLEIARHRIYAHPERYYHQIYGEHEAGGTGWLYLSAVPFDQLGFRTDLGRTPYPEYTREFLYAVPAILFGVPAFLLALNALAGEGGSEQPGELAFHPEDEEVPNG